MKNKMKKWVAETYPQKADWIINHALPEQIIDTLGIELLPNEIFVQYPKWEDYYGSNYGRLISYKFGRYLLRAQEYSSTGHVYYVLTQANKEKPLTLSGQRIVGDLFLPNYWPGLIRRQLQVHHLWKNPSDNNWLGLIMLPVYLHKWLEYADSCWLNTGDGFQQKTPYQILEETGLTLEEIIYPIRREPDFRVEKDGHIIEAYEIGGVFIGFELADPNFRKKLKDRGYRVGKSQKK